MNGSPLLPDRILRVGTPSQQTSNPIPPHLRLSPYGELACTSAFGLRDKSPVETRQGWCHLGYSAKEESTLALSMKECQEAGRSGAAARGARSTLVVGSWGTCGSSFLPFRGEVPRLST